MLSTPLSEIKPGMLGEWHTTVSGSRVDSFPMKVVGIAENFIGPQRPVIICEALDATKAHRCLRLRISLAEGSGVDWRHAD